jgi:hypothetical protein
LLADALRGHLSREPAKPVPAFDLADHERTTRKPESGLGPDFRTGNRAMTKPGIRMGGETHSRYGAWLQAQVTGAVRRFGVASLCAQEPISPALRGPAFAGKIVADSVQAGLAIESGCEWVTADTDSARFAPLLRWRLL